MRKLTKNMALFAVAYVMELLDLFLPGLIAIEA